MSVQYQLARDSLCESAKFTGFMDREVWPTEMITRRDNLLRSARYDTYIIENRVTYNYILPALLNRYLQLYPALSNIKWANYTANKLDTVQAGQNIDDWGN